MADLLAFEAAEVVENPVVAAAEPTTAGSDRKRTVSYDEMEAALAGLQEGTHTPEMAMASLDSYVKGIVDVATQGPGAQADRAIRSIVGRLAAAPANWHQTTVYVLGATDVEDGELKDIKARATRYFGLGVLLVLMQLVSAQAVLAGTYKQSCTDNDHCATLGTFCRVGFENTCFYCGSLTKDPTALINQECDAAGDGLMDVEKCLESLEEFYEPDLNHVAKVCNNASLAAYIDGRPEKGIYPPDYVASWCDACVHPVSGTVHMVSRESVVKNNIDSMTSFDIATYVLASSMVALTICGELQDITICSRAIEQLGDRLGSSWRVALHTLSLIRHMVFLPNLLATVPMLVAFQGGDAISIW